MAPKLNINTLFAFRVSSNTISFFHRPTTLLQPLQIVSASPEPRRQEKTAQCRLTARSARRTRFSQTCPLTSALGSSQCVLPSSLMTTTTARTVPGTKKSSRPRSATWTTYQTTPLTTPAPRTAAASRKPPTPTRFTRAMSFPTITHSSASTSPTAPYAVSTKPTSSPSCSLFPNTPSLASTETCPVLEARNST